MLKCPGYARIPALIVILSLLLGGCDFLKSIVQGPTPIPYVTSTPEIQAVKPTVKVERGDVIRTQSYTGYIVSKLETQLQFHTAGRVENLPVQQGDQVKKGQLLAQLQITVSEYDLKKAQIALDRAKLAYQQTEMNTPESQKDRDVVLGLKKADVDLAQVELDELNSQLDASKLTAPSDGVIIALFISGSDSIEPFKPVMILADPNQLEISVNLSSADLEKLSEKMPVSYSLVSDPTTLLSGLIRRLPLLSISSAQRSANTDNSVRITLDKKSSGTGPALGSAVKVQVDLEKRPGVLWLPPNAINKIGSSQYVYVQNGGKQTQVAIQTGLSTTQRVEILSGLTEGQVIVLP